MFIGIAEVYIKKSHYLTFTGIILYQVDSFKVKWGAKLAITSSSHYLWIMLIKYLYFKLLYPTELWHAKWNRNYHISGHYQTIYSPTNAHNVKNVELLKQFKIKGAAPTCFGLQGNHRRGATAST